MTDMPAGRDFIGYGASLPDANWPGKARVAVSFVLNIEEGAELSIRAGDERNEGVYEAVEEIHDAVDPCQDSHYEYGTRAGYWRIIETLSAAGVAVTLNACGRAIERSPWIARDAVERGGKVALQASGLHSELQMPTAKACFRLCLATAPGTFAHGQLGSRTTADPEPNTAGPQTGHRCTTCRSCCNTQEKGGPELQGLPTA